MRMILFFLVYSGVGLALLAAVVFVVCLMLLLKKRMGRRGLLLSFALCVVLFGGCIWQANDFFSLGIGVPRTFSVENWAKTDPTDRHFMLPDLERQVSLVGMSANEVRALLGEPDHASSETQLAYIIDSDWIDYIVLDLKLENGVVTQTTMSPD